MRRSRSWKGVPLNVGMDVHKGTIVVAERDPSGSERERTLPNEPKAVSRGIRKVVREAPGPVRCAYEAGPCGYALQRQLESEGVHCVVIAPSLIPRKPGERVKTDRRDARKLAELFAGGLLTEVHSPTPEAEAVRDLCRAREDAKLDQTRTRRRLGKSLLRHGLIWGRKNWTQAHQQWLRGLLLEHPAEQATFDAYCTAVDQAANRLHAIGRELAVWAEMGPYASPVARLRCQHGIDTTTAMTIVTELHDSHSFRRARELMGFVGRVPSEHSSGEQRARGAITKTGNAHVRRVLVEAAWPY